MKLVYKWFIYSNIYKYAIGHGDKNVKATLTDENIYKRNHLTNVWHFAINRNHVTCLVPSAPACYIFKLMQRKGE